MSDSILGLQSLKEAARMRLGNNIHVSAEMCIEMVDRIAELEAENEALGEKVERLESLARAVVEAVDALPVVEMIDGPADDPVLIGYAMQAHGEWDELRRNANALAEAIGGEEG